MDPIADFITIIRNGYLAKKDVVTAGNSKIRLAIANILVANGFLTSADLKDNKINLTLHYMGNGDPVLTQIKRISKPGVRRYCGADQIPSALSGAGVTILSTSAGLLTDKEARTKKLGGEIICQVW